MKRKKKWRIGTYAKMAKGTEKKALGKWKKRSWLIGRK